MGIKSTKERAAADIMAIKAQAETILPKASENGSDGGVNDSAAKYKSPLEQINDETDILKDGRYRPAKPETMEFMRQTQQKGMGLSNVNDPMAIQKYIREQEGLDLGVQRRRELAKQWRFFLSCEPIQRGMDAGFVLGSLVAFGAAYQPRNRHPLKLCCFWFAGFGVGMITLPLSLSVLELYNMERIKSREGEMYAKQRQAFHEQELKNN